MLFHQLCHIFRFQATVENLIGVYDNDRPHLTKTGAAAHHQPVFISDFVLLQRFNQCFFN